MSVPVLAVQPDGCTYRFESVAECCAFYGIRRRTLVTAEARDEAWNGIYFDYGPEVPDSVVERLRSQGRKR